MKRWGIVAGVVGLVVLALLGGLLLGRHLGLGYAGYPGGWGGRIGGHMIGPGIRMGGFGPLGWMFPLLGMLVALALLALLVAGVVWIVQNLSRPAAVAAGPQVSPAAGRCPQCERPTLSDWRLCPYCGAKLTD
jgi:hypothetical protein